MTLSIVAQIPEHPKCAGTTTEGAPCRANAMRGLKVCPTHAGPVCLYVVDGHYCLAEGERRNLGTGHRRARSKKHYCELHYRELVRQEKARRVAVRQQQEAFDREHPPLPRVSITEPYPRHETRYAGDDWYRSPERDQEYDYQEEMQRFLQGLFDLAIARGVSVLDLVDPSAVAALGYTPRTATRTQEGPA